MKTLKLASLLALTAMSGVVVASQPAAALRFPPVTGGCGMTWLCGLPKPPLPPRSPVPGNPLPPIRPN
jgi:hypothetical protein